MLWVGHDQRKVRIAAGVDGTVFGPDRSGFLPGLSERRKLTMVPTSPQKPKLLDRLRHELRYRHYAYPWDRP